MNVDLYDYESNLKHKARVEFSANRAYLYFKNRLGKASFQYISARIKGLEGAQWEKDMDGKPWSFIRPENSRRNLARLGLLTGGTWLGTEAKPFDRYFLPTTKGIVPSRDNLRPYQKYALDLIFQRRCFLPAIDMGMGKTLIMIELLEHIKKHSTLGEYTDSDLFWVIGPKSAIVAWRDQLIEWKARVKPQLIINSPQRIKRAMDNATIPPCVIINDESLSIANPKAQRSQLFAELTRLSVEFWGGPWHINMTGTPAPQNPDQWWNQIESIIPGALMERSPVQLRHNLAYTEEIELAHGTVKKVTGWNTEKVANLHERLKPFMIRMEKKDYLNELPEKQYTRVVLPPDPSLLATARMLATTCSSGMEALMKCRQLSDGFLYEHTDAGERLVKEIPSPKVQYILDKLDEFKLNERKRLIVYAAFKASIDRVNREIRETNYWQTIRVDGRGWATSIKGVEASQTLFRTSEEPLVFVANPESAAEGLTLTASDTIIFYSNSFKARYRPQAEDRIYRIGSRGANIIDLIHLPTDLLVLDRIKQGRDLEAITLGEVIDEMDRLALEGIA